MLKFEKEKLSNYDILLKKSETYRENEEMQSLKYKFCKLRTQMTTEIKKN